METITPDSPYMLLENGEYATLPENLNFIFEVGDLENELPENIVEQVETNQTLCQGGKSWQTFGECKKNAFTFLSICDRKQKNYFLQIHGNIVFDIVECHAQLSIKSFIKRVNRDKSLYRIKINF